MLCFFNVIIVIIIIFSGESGLTSCPLDDKRNFSQLLRAACPSSHPTNSIKDLMAKIIIIIIMLCGN